MDEFKALFDRAYEAGNIALEACVPTPVTWAIATDITGNAIEPGSETTDPEGECGCAWAVIRPGNCRFANWLKRENIGSYDSYRKGVLVSYHGRTQSIERRAAWAEAFAGVLREAGIRCGVSRYLT